MQIIKSSAAAIQDIMQPKTQVNGNVNKQIGATVDMGSFLGVSPVPTTLTYTLNNSAGMTAVNYMIGDAIGVIAAGADLTVSNPSLANGLAGLVAPQKAGFQSRPVVIRTINYKTSSDATQFDQVFRAYVGNLAGEVVPKNIYPSAAERNTAENTLLLTLQGEWALSDLSGLYITVLAGETVSLTLTVDLAK